MTVSPEESDPTTASDTHAPNPPHKVWQSGDVIFPLHHSHGISTGVHG